MSDDTAPMAESGKDTEAAMAEGTSAPKRRRGRPRKVKTDPESVPSIESASETQSAPMAEDQPVVSPDVVEQPSPKPRRRRRTKDASDDAPAVEGASEVPSTGAEAAPVRRRRGRPRKVDTDQGAAAEVPQDQETSTAQSIDPMTRLIQEATVASADPTPMPAQTLDEVPAEAPVLPREETSPAQDQEAQPAQESGKRSRNRHTKSEVDASQQSQQSQQSAQQNAQQGTGQSRRQGQSRRRNRRGQDTPVGPSVSKEELSELKVAELRSKAAELGVDYVGVRKADLVDSVFEALARAEGFRPIDGILEIGSEGYGWVRTGNYMEGDDDAFVHQQMIRSLGLRAGDRIQGTVGPGRTSSKYPPVQRINLVNGVDPQAVKARPRFRDLTPIFPNERLRMENGKDSITGRAIDLVSPIGKGQRGLIVSPPKAGKTTVLKKICQSIAANNPEVHLFCLLVDERPEEVTDMQRSIKGEVVASTFDMPPENHTRVAELVIERAKRLVEMGGDVVVVLDSITRLARAYNLAAPPSGRILSGGVDSAALYPPKKFLGAARNIEGGGSLTIIASALVDTGSKMDEVIFEEFKGTGNMELKLDRDLSDKRIFPAIDPVASGTRNEDLLISTDFQPLVWGIRRVLANMNNVERAANALVKGLKGTKTNEEFLIRSAKKAAQTDYIA